MKIYSMRNLWCWRNCFSARRRPLAVECASLFRNRRMNGSSSAWNCWSWNCIHERSNGNYEMDCGEAVSVIVRQSWHFLVTFPCLTVTMWLSCGMIVRDADSRPGQRMTWDWDERDAASLVLERGSGQNKTKGTDKEKDDGKKEVDMSTKSTLFRKCWKLLVTTFCADNFTRLTTVCGCCLHQTQHNTDEKLNEAFSVF